MPTPKDHFIQPVFSDYKPEGQSDLEDWLAKEAEASKMAEATENDEGKSTTNYSALFDNPEGRRDGSNIDGQWGEPPNMENGRQEPFHQNDATYQAAQKERLEVARRAFDTLPAAQAVEKALLGKNFSHVASGDFTTHSVTLQPATKEGAARPTLSERVKHLIDR